MKKIIVGFMGCIILFLSGCTSEFEEYSSSFFIMDTNIEVSIFSYKNQDKLLHEIEDIYKKYHDFSDKYKYHNVNGIYKINENAGIRGVEVDSELVNIIKLSKDYFEKTNGAFNIAIGPVTTIWHNYKEEKNDIPTKEELESVRDLINPNDIEITNNTVFLKKEGMALDLGGVVKGYATQRVVEYLKENGIEYFLINAGGNIVAGKHPENRLWRIGIRDPKTPQDYYQIVELRDASLVTSGDYQRFFEFEGKKYHHIINNDTLYPLNLYRSVSVISDDSGISDILSTSIFNMSIEDGKNLVNSLEGHFKVYWYKKNGELFNYEKK